MRHHLLDLFCCGGGAGEGYRRAGFDVHGVDIEQHAYRPGPFSNADALEVMASVARTGQWAGRKVDAIHASPPCQRFSTATSAKDRHPDLITPLRPLLIEWGGPYIIENVPAAPLIDPMMLCGSMFAGLRVRRHRIFESNVPLEAPGACRHKEQGRPVGVYGQHADRRQYFRPDGTQRGTKARTDEEGRAAMGVDWPMPWPELAESIPPAYTRHLGRQLIAHLESPFRDN